MLSFLSAGQPAKVVMKTTAKAAKQQTVEPKATQQLKAVIGISRMKNLQGSTARAP
jgi:hypothetical protein